MVSEPKRDHDQDSDLDASPQHHVSGPVPKAPPSTAQPSAHSQTRSSLLHELDAPLTDRLPSESSQPSNDNAVSDVRQLAQRSSSAPSEAPADNAAALENRLVALAEAESIPDSDAATLAAASASVLSPKPAPEPNVATRSHTHVAEELWLDAKLDPPDTEADLRQRLAWRFKAAFTAWKLLLPACSPSTVRAQLIEGMRSYERLLRNAGPIPSNVDSKQLSDVLHSRLSEAKTIEVDRALGGLEELLMSADASITQEAFRARWNPEHTDLKQLLRYARFLASRRFNIGYRRDRFESIALALLTAKLPTGRLLLMPRRRAAQVLRQLLRGLHRPSRTSDDHRQAIAYLRDAFDRLDAIAGAKQFFDSGFYLDVYGYKISRYDRILSAEFLYLAVALEVDVHNHLLDWSETDSTETGKAYSPAALQLQLRAQKEAAQAVFADFHRPLVGSASPPKASESKKAKAKSASKRAAAKRSELPRLIAASVFALSALGANLYVTGAVQLREPPKPVAPQVLRSVSPLLLSARLSDDGKRLLGAVSRPNWRKLSPRQRIDAADEIASELRQRGIEHAELLAYKSRAIQIDYGTVVYVDDATY